MGSAYRRAVGPSSSENRSQGVSNTSPLPCRPVCAPRSRPLPGRSTPDTVPGNGAALSTNLAHTSFPASEMSGSTFDYSGVDAETVDVVKQMAELD